MQENILCIDLTTRTSRVERDPELFARFLGGTALGTELLWKYVPPETDPLGEESALIFVTGPFSSLFPVATKTVALFKSPLNGELGETHAGGRLAMALRDANIDALVITGKSSSPTVLSIENHRVTFASARTVWGQSSSASERILREYAAPDGRKGSVVRIGPAGERLSPLACATVDGARHFGRLGLGAVMGSKNLKAFLVFGTGGPLIADRGAHRKIYDAIHDRVVSSNDMKKYHDLGTAGNILPLNAIGGLPTRNFSQGFFEGAQALSGEAFAENSLVQHMACAHCPCGCIHLAALREPFAPFHYRTTKVPYDYELIYALGTLLSLSSPSGVLALVDAVEKEGWDAMGLGSVLAWASEAFLAGVVGFRETEGLPLRFGDQEGYLEAVRRIRSGSGAFFRDLEQGVAFCAKKYGGESFAIHFGGVGAPGYLTGENALITYLMGVRHSHLDDPGYSTDQKLLGHDIPLEDQVRSAVRDAQWRMVTNSLVTCLFARAIYDEKIVLEGLGALGLAWDAEKLRRLGEEALRRKYAYKIACGADPRRGAIPEKLFTVATATGPVDRERMAKRMVLYAQLVGLPEEA